MKFQLSHIEVISILGALRELFPQRHYWSKYFRVVKIIVGIGIGWPTFNKLERSIQRVIRKDKSPSTSFTNSETGDDQ